MASEIPAAISCCMLASDAASSPRARWATEISPEDAGSFALGLVFCSAVGSVFGAGETSQLGVPILPSEARQVAARWDGSGP